MHYVLIQQVKMVAMLHIITFVLFSGLGFSNSILSNFRTFRGYHPKENIQGGRRIWFDLSDLDPNAHISVSKLYLYHISDDSVSSADDAPYMVKVYRVERNETGGRASYFLDSKHVSKTYNGWTTFNVGPAVRHWLDHPNKNYGLRLKVTHPDHSGDPLMPDDAGFVNVKAEDKLPYIMIIHSPEKIIPLVEAGHVNENNE